MQNEEFNPELQYYRERIEIDNRKQQSLMLRFSPEFSHKMTLDTHYKVFRALLNDCDVYRIIEDLMDRQEEMSKLVHKLIARCPPNIMNDINKEP